MTHSRYQLRSISQTKFSIYPSQYPVMVFCLYGIGMDLNTIAHLYDKSNPVHLKVLQGVHLIRCYHFMLLFSNSKKNTA